MPAEIQGENSTFPVEYFSEDNLATRSKEPCAEVAQQVIKDSNPPSWTSRIMYEVSLQYTKATSNSWWHKIELFNLYLGAIPLKNKGHLEELQALGITHIISVVEDFELEDGWVNSPVKHADWKSAGITVKHIPAADYYGLKPDEIREGVIDLHEALERGEKVYIHCKAGRGRSATIVVAFLMQCHGYTLEKALEYVKEMRPDINLNQNQQQAIKNYFSGVSEANSIEGMATEDSLTKLLNDLLYYVIHGVNYSVDGKMPEAFQGWMPKVDIQSTQVRRDRYLREY